MAEITAIDPNNPLPRYYQVFSILMNRIETGAVKVGEALPSERLLVEEFGVSRITIVKAISELEKAGRVERHQGKGTFVLPAPKAEPASRAWIGFLCLGSGHPYLFSVLLGVSTVVSSMNFHLQILSVPKTIEDEIAMIEDFIGRGLQGLVVYARAGHGQLELLNSLVARRFPTVMIDRYYPNLDLDRVVFDDFEACYQLTAMLLAKGHRRIAVLPLDEIETTSVRDRLAGYRAALRDAGAAHDESLVWLDFYRDMVPPGAPPFPTHAEFVRRITRGHPTAVLALSGEAARRLAQVLLSVARPEEELGTRLEVVAVSHEAPSVFSPYPLTVALQDGEKLGAEAAKLLIERIRDGYDAPRKAIEVNMPIVTAA